MRPKRKPESGFEEKSKRIEKLKRNRKLEEQKEKSTLRKIKKKEINAFKRLSIK